MDIGQVKTMSGCSPIIINYLDSNPEISSLRVFYGVYGLEIQSVMLVLSTGLCVLLPL
jgi:hypothetical protein